MSLKAITPTKGIQKMTNTMQAVLDILARNTDIVSVTKIAIRGAKGRYAGSKTVITVQGDGVSTPFRRNYLKRKLAQFGAVVQRTARNSGVTTIAL